MGMKAPHITDMPFARVKGGF